MTDPTTPRPDVPDYAQTYDEFWREIVENPDGTLNLDQVMRELHDYRVVMQQVSIAYDDVTGGRISKPNTAAVHVIAEVDERLQNAADEARQQTLRDLDAGDITPEELTAAGLDPGHVVDLRADGWTLQHPLTCRTDLFACPVNRAAERDLVEPPGQLGRYGCALDSNGRFQLGELRRDR